MNGQKHVAIVGAGVVGTACTHYLVERGWRVTLIDRGKAGRQCSHGNCGYICPSHVLPLAAPGAISRSLKSMLAKDSPFYIKPRLSPTFWRWMLGFARRCNRRAMLESGHAIQPLLASSRTLYEVLRASPGIECEWQAKGLLFVFHSRHGMEHYAATDQLLREEFGVAAKPFHGDDLCRLEPALKSGLGGGWLYETDAHLRPDRLMSSWRTALESRGVTVLEDREVRGFVRENGVAIAAETAAGSIAADAFVLAAGALTPFLNDRLGCRIPIQPGKGYSITMPRPAICPAIPMIFEEHHVAVTPMETGYRLGSMMEFVGYDESIDPRRLEVLTKSAALYLHESATAPIQETWYGWRPMTPDSRPMIDRSPALANVVIAAGHNMLGLSMAPATGKLVAELLSGDPPHVDPAPYSARRF